MWIFWAEDFRSCVFFSRKLTSLVNGQQTMNEDTDKQALS